MSWVYTNKSRMLKELGSMVPFKSNREDKIEIEDFKKWRNRPCSSIGRFNTIKIHTIESNIQIQCNHNQNTKNILQELERRTENFIGMQELTDNQSCINNLDGGNIFPNPRTYYRAVVIKSAWYQYRNREENQWSKIETPEESPQMYTHLRTGRNRKKPKGKRWRLQ